MRLRFGHTMMLHQQSFRAFDHFALSQRGAQPCQLGVHSLQLAGLLFDQFEDGPAELRRDQRCIVVLLSGHLTDLLLLQFTGNLGIADTLTATLHHTFFQRILDDFHAVDTHGGHVKPAQCDVARLAGSPRAARQVGGVLKRLPAGSKLPWYRVVNRSGQISLVGNDLNRQRQALLEEGVEVSADGRIDMPRFRWQL